MTTQTRIIRVKVDTTGDAKLTRISREMGKLNQNTKRASVGIGRLSNAFTGLLAVIGVREIARAADQFQLLEDRISVFVGSAEKAEKTFKQLVFAAEATRTSVGSLAEVYNRVALATKELGLNSEQVISVTAALQQTFRLSGASIAEATAATIQLTQGLSSGQLRGQELRSVLESNSVVAGILAKELGTTRGQLIKFAEAGSITSEVVLTALSDNFKDVNDQAANLNITFEQAATIGVDKFKVAIADLNKEFGVAAGFQKGVVFVTDNLKTFFTLIGTAVTGGLIVKLGLGIKGLAAGLVTLLGPLPAIGVGLVAIAKGISLIDTNSPKTVGEGIATLTAKLVKQQEVLENAKKNVGKGKSFINILVESITGKDSQVSIKEFQNAIDITQKEIGRLRELQSKGITDPSGKPSIEDFFKKSQEALAKFIEGIKAAKQAKPAEPLEALNAAFSGGEVNILEYAAALDQLNIAELNKKFKEGKIDVFQYNTGILQASSSLSTLDQISRGVEQGLINVAKNAGNVAANIAQGIQRTFNTLEDSIVEFVKTGRFEFAKFTQAVLEDLTRIIVRAAIIAPIANALVAGATAGAGAGAGSATPQTGAGGGSFITPNAKGNAFSGGNIIPFASGGVVGSPTFFPLSGGRTGLMGEAGAEAILPLRRGPGGKLGVESSGGGRVTVNVINNSGGEVEQRERAGPDGNQVIDILIKDSVKDGINSGEFDSSLGEVFGLRRRGR